MVPDGSTIDVVITGTSGIPSSVTLNTEPNSVPVVIRNLSLDSFSTLTVAGITFNLAGSTLSNAGQINIGVAGPGNYANFYVVAPTVNLSGGGIVNLNNASSQLGSTGGNALVNMDNTIQGQGTITGLSNFTNQATVNANVSGGTLNIYVPTTNTGTLEATGGGTLELLQHDRDQYQRDHLH